MTDLAHYFETGEVPSDPVVLAELLAQMEIGDMDAESVEAANAVSAATSADTQKTEPEPDGILTKDGKHVISYDVLKNERFQRQEAERKYQELQAELERTKTVPTVVESVFAKMTPEEIADMQEYFPERYAAFQAQEQQLSALAQQNAEYQRIEQQRQLEMHRQLQMTVQEHVDANPVLSHWKLNNPEAWDYAVKQDEMLQVNPMTKDMPMPERFAKAAELAMQIYGNPVESAKPAPTKSQNAAMPFNSLSDLKGGEPVADNTLSSLEKMSTAQIANMMAGKTADQIAKMMNQFA